MSSETLFLLDDVTLINLEHIHQSAIWERREAAAPRSIEDRVSAAVRRHVEQEIDAAVRRNVQQQMNTTARTSSRNSKSMDKLRDTPALLSETYRVIARLRCLREAVDALANMRNMPLSLCYSPLAIPYVVEGFGCQKPSKPVELVFYAKPPIGMNDISLTLRRRLRNTIFWISTDAEGDFGEVLRVETVRIVATDEKEDELKELPDPKFRFVRLRACETTDKAVNLVTLPSANGAHPCGSTVRFFSWQDAVDLSFAFGPYHNFLRRRLVEAEADKVDLMTTKPTDNWTTMHDRALIEHIVGKGGSGLSFICGKTASYADKITLSSALDYKEVAVSYLTDDNPGTFWESDGTNPPHKITIWLKSNVVIEQVYILLDPEDESYLPNRVVVYGYRSETAPAFVLQETPKIETISPQEVCVLTSNNEVLHRLEIEIVECKEGGLDCRVRGIRLKSKNDLARPEVDCAWFNRVDAPILAGISSERLYWRAIVLTRLASLIDYMLPYTVPNRKVNTLTKKEDWLQRGRMLLPLCKRRQAIVDCLLRASADELLTDLPKLYVDRQSSVPVFEQIFDELRRDRQSKLTFRWSTHSEQWWECVFIGEGVIDQGGAFRDSLCDVGENLCPAAGQSRLPYFVRSYEDASVFVMDRHCERFAQFEFIGKLMGSCVRTKEFLVLPLAPSVWKRLVGERLVWAEDGPEIDRNAARLIERVQSCKTREDFESLVALEGGEILLTESVGPLSWNNRLSLIESAKAQILTQAESQLLAIRRGLTSVVPESALSLMTWQCLERMVCGRAEIEFEDLKRACHLEDFNESDRRVQFLWQALQSFSYDERSRFLRFVSGRRRMPTQLYICAEKSEGAIDSLPESSTCSNTLYLPDYTTGEICSEKLRYAISHCTAIDTDVNPWES
uniref:HECT domain-containing protein n=1 Tax=Plectus sambesii TaxID=2011161 RepID=A0A914W714_9BILA